MNDWNASLSQVLNQNVASLAREAKEVLHEMQVVDRHVALLYRLIDMDSISAKACLDDVKDIQDKTVVMRVDYNVPMKEEPAAAPAGSSG